MEKKEENKKGKKKKNYYSQRSPPQEINVTSIFQEKIQLEIVNIFFVCCQRWTIKTAQFVKMRDFFNICFVRVLQGEKKM